MKNKKSNTNISTNSCQCDIDEIIVPKGKVINQDKVKQLAESIEKIGLLSSIIISPDKHLIAGVHRLEAHKLLGRKKIPAIVKDVSKLIKELTVVDENLVRKHLSYLEECDLLKKRDDILDSMGIRAKAGDNKHTIKSDAVTTKIIAKNSGKSERTLQRKRYIANNLAPEVIDMLKGSNIANNSSALTALSHQPENIKKITAKYIAGGMPFRKAIKNANRTLVHKKLEKVAKNYSLPKSVELLLGDFREVSKKIKDNSIDLLLTDPLYCKDALKDYKDLTTVASHILKPGAFLVVYCGILYLPEILKYLEQAGLVYHWIGGIFFQKGQNREMSRKVTTKYRPVVFYRKPGGKKSNRFFQDIFACEPENDLHHYQQNIKPIRHWIKSLTNPGDIVVDCFLGTGTTGVAAVSEMRKFIGMDIKESMLKIAKNRIISETQEALKKAA